MTASVRCRRPSASARSTGAATAISAASGVDRAVDRGRGSSARSHRDRGAEQRVKATPTATPRMPKRAGSVTIGTISQEIACSSVGRPSSATRSGDQQAARDGPGGEARTPARRMRSAIPAPGGSRGRDDSRPEPHQPRAAASGGDPDRDRPNAAARGFFSRSSMSSRRSRVRVGAQPARFMDKLHHMGYRPARHSTLRRSAGYRFRRGRPESDIPSRSSRKPDWAGRRHRQRSNRRTLSEHVRSLCFALLRPPAHIGRCRVIPGAVSHLRRRHQLGSSAGTA